MREEEKKSTEIVEWKRREESLMVRAEQSVLSEEEEATLSITAI